MTSPLVLLLVGVPAVAAALAPVTLAAIGRWRPASSAYCLLAHAVTLGLAIVAFRATTPNVTLHANVDRLGPPAVLSLDHAASAEVLVAAILFLAVSAYSADFVRGVRHGGAFLGLLFVEQAAINLVLLADNLLGLYAGLVVLSLSLMLMIGLDFAAPGGNAALRIFATLEVPAAVALAQLSIGDSRIGTLALADLARQAPWLGQTTALVVSVPIAVALASRAGLTPLQHWVVVGCRAAAAPVAVAVAGLALPVGGIVLARALGSGILDPIWLQAAEGLGAATALVAAVGALREHARLGWLAYVAVAQVGLASVGFALASPRGLEAGWLTLGFGALAVTLTGLGLAQTLRSPTQPGPPARASLTPDWLSRVALGVGLASLVPLPPFASFPARRVLVGALLEDNSPLSRLVLAGVLVATLLLAASIWQTTFSSLTSTSAPSSVRRSGRTSWNVGGVLALLVGLTAGAGIIPRTWLIDLATAEAPPVADGFGDLVATLLVGLTVGVAVGWCWLAPRRRDASTDPGGAWRRISGAMRRVRLNAALDPYLLVGGLLLALGRLSALILNNTLGRLVRAD